jgi:hypothetical protein
MQESQAVPYKFRLWLNMAGCGPANSFNRWTSPGIA